MSFDERLDQIVSRHQELSNLMSSGDGGDADQFVSMSKEFSELDPIVASIGQLRDARNEAGDLAELIADPETDAEMKTIAQEEFQELTVRIPELEKNLQIMLLPRDLADDKNAILEVRAGTGGDEAALFAADLLRMYQRYADKHRWKFEIMSSSDTGIGGIKEASAEISGKGVFARLKYESGVHRVQRVPETESGGRIDRNAPVTFTFNGRSYRGYRGDHHRGYRGERYYRNTYRGYRGGYRGGYRCRDNGTGGTIIGAIAGGLLGNEVGRNSGRYGRGDGTAGAIIGAGVGALAGRAIDRNC